jgi:GTP cyclohydrolase IB
LKTLAASAAASAAIPDTQSESDARHLAIARVGIKDVRYPLMVVLDEGPQSVQATWDLDVALPAERKGTHMSRFVEWLEDLNAPQAKPIDVTELRVRMHDMLKRLNATDGRVQATFTFFVRKAAPVTGAVSRLDYRAKLIAEGHGGVVRVLTEVVVPVKSLCPCSKEISAYGAHNQRSLVTVCVEPKAAIGWTELVRFAENAASSELWPLLKRPDEKWVTEHAYDNPKFVEDLARDVALALNADARVGRYSVDVENLESIHNHSAYARIEREI